MNFGRKFVKKVWVVSICFVMVFMSGCGKNKLTDNYSKVVYNKDAKKKDIKDGKIAKDAVVLTVGDVDVTYSEALIYILSMKQNYEMMFGDYVWGYSFENTDEKDNAKFEDLAKEEIIKQICILKVVEQISEEKLDIKLNTAEKVEASDKALEYLGNISMKDQKRYGITQDIAIKFFEDNYLVSKVYDYVTIDVEETTQEEARIVELKQIEVKKSEKNAYKKIMKIYKEIKSNEDDFSKIASKESWSKEKKVSLSRGEKDKNYEKVAYSLSENEISSVVETDDAYYILCCVSENDTVKAEENKERMDREKLSTAFVEKYNEWIDNCDIYIVSELWNKMSFKEIGK